MLGRLTSGVVAGVLVVGGAAVASADTAHDASVKRGMPRFEGAVAFNYQVKDKIWTSRVSGRLFNDGHDHVYVQVRPDTYGYRTYADTAKHESAPVDARVRSDVRHVGSVSVNACESAIGPDRCKDRTIANPHRNDRNCRN